MHQQSRQARVFASCACGSGDEGGDASRDILSRAIAQTADSVIVTDVQGNITYVNPAFEVLTGYSSGEVLGRQPSIVKSGLHDAAFYATLWRTILAGGVFRGIVVNRRKSGELLHEEKTITPVRDERGEIVSFVSTAKDVTDRVRAEERLRVLVDSDPLTGLPNRNLFGRRLGEAIARARGMGSRLALLLLDLDRFKDINDTFGHETGDAVLVEIARRLRGALPIEATVARIGGDEFVVLFDELTECEAAGVARDLVRACERAIESAGRRHFVTSSIGVAVFPGHGEDASTLLRNADIAMYHAKSVGRNAVVAYDDAMGATIERQSAMEALLREAIERRELALAYQPQVDLASGRVVGVEALLRWRSASLGDVPPASFIPVLENCGQIVGVGDWVLRTAIEEVRVSPSWVAGMCLAVNISPRQFRDAGFMALAGEAHQRAEAAGIQLQFEITESLLMADLEDTIDKVRRLAELGVRLAVDDFGTGYSSLAYLRLFRLHILKIDRSFISGRPRDEASLAITQAIIQLAKALGLSSVAEGVETGEQLGFLRDAGCDAAQGYFLRRPGTLDEALRPLAHRGP